MKTSRTPSRARIVDGLAEPGEKPSLVGDGRGGGGWLHARPPAAPETPTIVTVNPAASGMGVGSSAVASPTGPTRRSRFGLVSMAFSMLAPIAVRAAQNYAIQYMEQWLAAQQGPTGPAYGPGPGSGQAGEHRTGRTTTGSDGGARPSTPLGPVVPATAVDDRPRRTAQPHGNT